MLERDPGVTTLNHAAGAAGHPWAAYSWGYEVMLSRACAWFGLVGVGIYGTALALMVAFSVLWMTGRLSGRFWLACMLAAVCCYANCPLPSA